VGKAIIKHREGRKVFGVLCVLKTTPALSAEPFPAQSPTTAIRPQVKQEPYLLKPLTGCVISTTNFEPNMRLTIQPFITQYGGTYSAQLVKDQCTHLVCARAGGSKYS
jgi:hypothetical protein